MAQLFPCSLFPLELLGRHFIHSMVSARKYFFERIFLQVGSVFAQCASLLLYNIFLLLSLRVINISLQDMNIVCLDSPTHQPCVEFTVCGNVLVKNSAD